MEAGTSFGVSTLYLAAAVRDNQVENGVVIGTEYEPKKAEAARANFEEAGLSEFIELREGDLRETLQDVGGPVDFMLVDIWEVALPALELVSPSILLPLSSSRYGRMGSVVNYEFDFHHGLLDCVQGPS